MERKIVCCLMFFMACGMSATAQDAVSVIRKHYADAKEKVAEFERTEEERDYSSCPLCYEVNIMQNLPGTGPHNERMRMFYNVEDNEDWEPDEPMLSRSLFFATWKYNFAVREFYEEYLYDEKGNIEFAYKRDADLDDVGGELRFYFKNGKLFKVLVSILNPETDKYEQTYSGATMPKKYEDKYKSCIYMVEKFKRLFNELDRDTFH